MRHCGESMVIHMASLMKEYLMIQPMAFPFLNGISYSS